MRFHPYGTRRRGLTSLAIAIPVALVAVGCTAASAEDAEPPVLESRVKDIIELDGQSFKDLNANGELDAYEDWR